jgi:predicted ATPase
MGPNRHVQLVGAFSCGKSTHAAQLEKDGFKVIPEIARLILDGNPYFLGSVSECAKAGRYEEFQWRVTELSAMSERAYRDEDAVIDAGTLSAWAYAGLCEKPTADMLRNKIADHLVACPPRKALYFEPLPIDDDGVRHTDQKLQKRISHEILACCRKFGIIVETIVATNVKDRHAQVLRSLRRRDA